MQDPERSETGELLRACKTVILAGGFGTRLAERTDDLPKPMVEIGRQPMLWHILKGYSRWGCHDFIIAAGWRSEVIKRYFVDYQLRMSDMVFDFSNAGGLQHGAGAIEHRNTCIEPWRIAVIDTGEQTMTGGRLRRLREVLGERTFLMTYGDGVADVDLSALLQFHRAHGRAATFTAVQQPTQFGVPRLEGDRAVAFAEKPAGEGDWINAGFFVLEARALDGIAGDHESFELHTLPQLAHLGQLMAYRHRGFWQPMDTLRDVRKLNALWDSGAAPWMTWNGT